MTTPITQSDTPVGNFIPMNGENNAPVALAMQNLFITGHIMPCGARVVVRHTFTSAEKKAAEIIYAFALPKDAALRRFLITGNGFKARSELKPTATAEKDYETGIAQGHLSTIVRQFRDGYVNLSVGNVRPGETVTVLLEIMCGVELRDDGLRFRFPFTLAPCYHAEARTIALDDNVGEIELPSDKFGDLMLPPFHKDASALHHIGFSLSTTMPGGICEAGSPSHPVTCRTLDADRVLVNLAGGHAVPDRDLVIDVKTRQAWSGVLAGADKQGQGHFAAVIASSKFGQASTAPRRIALLIDRSGSMEGTNIKQARNAALACVGALGPEDMIGCVAFDDKASMFANTLQPAHGETREQLRQFISSIKTEGSTELLTGIRATAGLFDGKGGDTFLLTDGQVAETDTIINIAKSLNIRLHCLGIGAAGQDRFLTQLSRATDGVSRLVSGRERVDVAALEFFSAVGAPLATDVTAHIEGLSNGAISPEPASIVYSNVPMTVFGSADPGKGSLVLEYKTGQPLRSGSGQSAQKMEIPLEIKPSSNATTLKLLRGSRLISDLESRYAGPQGETDREQKRIGNAIEELSKTYGLASRRMSLVAVVEREGDQPGTLPKTMVVPVGLPEDLNMDAYFSRGSSLYCCEMAPSFPALPKLGMRGLKKSAPALLAMFQPGDMGWSKSRQGPGKARFSVASDQLHVSENAPAPSYLDSLIEMAGRIEADGGMPGKTPLSRVVKSLIALLAMLELQEADGNKAFASHIVRLTGFLKSPVADALPADLRQKLDKTLARIDSGASIPGPWQKVAEDISAGRRFAAKAMWEAL